MSAASSRNLDYNNAAVETHPAAGTHNTTAPSGQDVSELEKKPQHPCDFIVIGACASARGFAERILKNNPKSRIFMDAPPTVKTVKTDKV